MAKAAVGIAVGIVGILVGCKDPSTAKPGAAVVDRPFTQSSTPPTTSVATDTVVATVAGRPITEQALRDPLVEAYGLNMLLNLVQHELTQREAERAGITATDADIAAERQRTVDRMFEQSNVQQLERIETVRANNPAEAERMLAELRKENEEALDQLLLQQRASRPEFELVIRTNATLRKLAEPQVEAAITEERLAESFRIQYGEKVLVRHIQANNLADLNTARRRIAAGESFEQVATEISTNRVTGPLGGEVVPFTRNNTAFPQTFRDAAFGLKVGEVSEAVQADGAYHIIKLEQRIDPTVVKFEDVKESVRADLNDRLLQAAVRNLRQQITQDALAQLQVNDPILKRQLADRMEQQQAKVRDREEVREELNRQREAIAAEQARELAATTQAATQAGTQPAPATTAPVALPPAPTTVTTAPATQSADAPVVLPANTPATRPASFVDGVLPDTMPAPMKPIEPAPARATTPPATSLPTTFPAMP
ncbi:MAG TPA: peptidyl-prolyl cis-trans isomerase [Tepidisphaeraceae bacterium]|jgi:parvulin-like peptidyl-prolyl isomerase|nr:peptidyl-prolyl cis-trans isomerase [Tepidisphaeraceae bacterium]